MYMLYAILLAWLGCAKLADIYTANEHFLSGWTDLSQPESWFQRELGSYGQLGEFIAIMLLALVVAVVSQICNELAIGAIVLGFLCLIFTILAVGNRHGGW